MLGRRLLVTLLLAAACSGDGGVKDDELEGLVLAPPEEPAAIDLDKAVRDGDELRRALAMRHHLVGRHLGAHTATITSRLEVQEGGKVVESLSDETTLAFGDGGAFHAVYANSADYGREVVFDGTTLLLRPRHARWHRRAPNDEREPIELRDQLFAVAGDYFDVVAHAAEVSDKGAAQVAGRAGRRVEIKLDPSPGKPPAQPLTQRKWRESVTVQALDGEAILDAETAAPLQARFRATFTFVRDGRTFTQTIDVGHELTAIGQAPTLPAPPPEEIVATPERSREVDERDRLLEGMAPPAKRAGGAAVLAPDDGAGGTK